MGVAQEDIERAKTELRLWIEDFLSSTSTEKWAAKPDHMERGPYILAETRVDETVRDLATTLSSPASTTPATVWVVNRPS